MAKSVMNRSIARQSANARASGLVRLLAGVSTGAAALALALNPASVRAQAVNGTPTGQFGVSSVVRDSVTKTDTVIVNSSEALVDWTSTDSGGVFLPNGATLNFQTGFSGSSGGYTVLNRVTSAASGGPLSIAGAVNSDSQGKVWFYNPGGWVVGSTGVFNVGSLVLTSLPITVDLSGDPPSRLYGANGEIRFGTAINPASSVAIANGAQINANLASSSYVALVAPKVSQGGTVRVDGSTAYVAAEAATLTINNGLFDIVVDSGSADSVGVEHTGQTTGPAGSLTDPNHRIHIVAVPKNQAMTAMIAGSLGYAAAVSASEQDGAIVLSAGYDVSDGAVANAAPVGGNASINISGLSASNRLSANASGQIAVNAQTADVTFASDASLAARGNVSVNVSNARALGVGGTFDIVSGSGATGRDVTITVESGSSFAVTGDFNASSIAAGAIRVDPMNGDALLAGSTGEAATSGDVAVNVRDANFSVGGDMTLLSQAAGGVGELSAGTASAGNVTFSAVQGNSNPNAPLRSVTLNAASYLRSEALDASQFGPATPLTGAASSSGDVAFSVDGGALTTLSLNADSYADASRGADGGAQGASAGKVSFEFANSAETFSTYSIGGASSAYAENSGAAALGDVSMLVDAAVLSLDANSYSSINLEANSSGTLATPNTISLTVTNGSTLAMSNGYITLRGSSGDALETQLSSKIDLTVSNSDLNTNEIIASTTASGQNSGVDAIGGDISVSLQDGGALQVTNRLSFRSLGFGGRGDDGGDGTGGKVNFAVTNATLDAGSLSLLSRGASGERFDPAGRSGTGFGGTAAFQQLDDRSVTNVGEIFVLSYGIGGFGESSSGTSGGIQAGDGSSGIGGLASFVVGAGDVTSGSLSVQADGFGGDARNVSGFDPGTGGTGTGGTASFAIEDGDITISTINVTASGFGGDGASTYGYYGVTDVASGRGGDGFGGSARIDLNGGNLYAADITLAANGNKSYELDYGGEFARSSYAYTVYFGNGGSISDEDGTAGGGGHGEGGVALLTVDGGALLTMDAQGFQPLVATPLSVRITAIGEGGPGGYALGYSADVVVNSGSGGSGQGGSAGINFLSGMFDATEIEIDASGLGGLSGNETSYNGYGATGVGSGGSAIGGDALFVIGQNFGQDVQGTTRTVTVRADGIGQDGGDGIIAGAGGGGAGGSAAIRVEGGETNLLSPTLSAVGRGGIGGSSGLGNAGGQGGTGEGGTAMLSAVGEGATLTVSAAVFDVAGTGGQGGSGGNGDVSFDQAGNGGAGGNGIGGSIQLLASDLGALSLSGLSSDDELSARGIGGNGGFGGNASLNGGTMRGNGGAGGNATGGTVSGAATNGGTLTLGSFALIADAEGGHGGGRLDDVGNGPFGSSFGGAGGNATGGAVTLRAAGAGSSLTVDGLFGSADGLAGNGANGAGFVTATGAGVNGAAGGDGFGGTIAVLAEDNGVLAIAAPDGEASFAANGIGGSGGAGSSGGAGTGANGGNGGAGGLGQGGFITIAANMLGSASLAPSGTVGIEANGYGGFGGAGGDGASNQGQTGLGGNGGNAGLNEAGFGGIINLSAGGGSLELGELSAAAQGFAAFDSFAGSGGSGPGGSGNSGAGTYVAPVGGSIALSSADDENGNDGNLIAGDTSLNVTSAVVFSKLSYGIAGVSGAVAISNTSSRTTDGIRLSSLRADASGIAGDGSGITLSAINGPITIDGDLQLLASGPITLAMNPQANIAAGGFADIFSDSSIAITGAGNGQFTASSISLNAGGTVAIAAIECAGETCSPVQSADGLSIYAGSSIDLSGGAGATGLGSVDVNSGHSITGDAGSGFFSDGQVRISGAGDVTVRNAGGQTVEIYAGAVFDGDPYYYPGLLTLGEVEGGGLISGRNGVSMFSGGKIIVTDGNRIESGTGMIFNSGNDIVVGANNLISGNTSNPDGPSAIEFAAGSLDLNYTLDAGDIAALSFAQGTVVDSGSGGVRLSGAAIDARGASFLGGFFVADVTRALALGDARGNDGGRLDPLCLEGGICLGDVDVDGSVDVGAGPARAVAVRGEGSLSGRTIRVSALGNVTLVDGSIVRGGTVALSGGGSLLGAGQITATADDVGLTFGGDVNATSITAARQLTTAAAVGGAAETAFTTPGSMRVGSLTLGRSANIAAGADLAIGQLSMGGASAVLTAGNALSLTTAVSVDDLSLTGASAQFGALSVGGDLLISAGIISGTSATAGGLVRITSSGGVNLAAVNAGTDLTISARDLTVPVLKSGGNLVLRVVNAAGLGTITSGGTVDIDPVLLTFDTITSVGNTSLAGTTITGGSIVAGGAVDVVAGDFTFTTIKAGGAFSTSNSTMTGTSIAAGGNVQISSSGAVGLAALSGADVSIGSGDAVNIAALTASGRVSVSADAVSLASAGALLVQSITAFNGNIEVTTAGSLQGGSFSARGDVLLRSTGGSVIINGLSAGYADSNSTALRANAVTAGVIGQGDVLIDAAQDIEINRTADAANAFVANAGGTIRLNALTAGKAMTLTSADIAIGANGQLGDATHTDSITLTSTAQGATLLGDNVQSPSAGYALSQAEFGRIRSRGSFTLNGRAPLLVGDLAITAQSGTNAGQVGETGRVTLESDGLASVVGAVTMANANGNTLAIHGDDGVYLDAATGSIRLLDGQSRAGSLMLSGSGIAMVTRSALDAIAGFTTTSAITDRLGQNDGVTAGRTLVEADAIRLTSDREVYVQNTATGTDFADRLGLIANTLTIDSFDGATHDIVINGVVGGATGIDAIALIDFEDEFTSLSSVNGCVIANVAACNAPQLPDISAVNTEVRDLIEDQLSGKPEDTALQVVDGFTRTTLIQLNQIAPVGFEPLIDEPVTGTGNDDLLGDGR